jgi:hypothetical protein
MAAAELQGRRGLGIRHGDPGGGCSSLPQAGQERGLQSGEILRLADR